MFLRQKSFKTLHSNNLNNDLSCECANKLLRAGKALKQASVNTINFERKHAMDERKLKKCGKTILRFSSKLKKPLTFVYNET